MKLICYGYYTLPIEEKNIFFEKLETVCRDTLDKAIILREFETKISYIIKLNNIKCYYFIFKPVITNKSYIIKFLSYFKNENPEMSILVADYNINLYELNC